MPEQHPLTFTVVVALVGIVPVSIGLFAYLSLRRAVLVAFLLGWMFLPQGAIPVQGVLPDWSRMTAITGAVLFCLVLLDFERLASFRPRLFDLPLIVFCAAPLVSSLANGLGVYDGLGNVLHRLIQWGLVYFIGRLYFSDWDGLKQLALGLFLAGLAYAPFCLYEMRMSPQLHNVVYGYHQHSFSQTYRLGGWRPMVFLQHGLAVGMWMTAAALVGSWLWLTGGLRRLGALGFPLLAGLVGVAVLCRSLFAIFLLTAGLAALMGSLATRRGWPIVLLTCLPLVYMGVRTTGSWTGEDLVATVADAVNPDRAQSVEFRLQNEDMLAARALQQPIFGWGGWARAHVHDETGKRLTVADGYWIIVFGENGIVGLGALTLVFLLPVWTLLAYRPPGIWTHADLAPALGMATLLAVTMIDNLMNAMFNPLIVLAVGGLTGLTSSLVRLPRAARGLRGLLTPEALLQLSLQTLTAEARARWGAVGVKRRELSLRRILEELQVDPTEPTALALRRVVLSLNGRQLEAFEELPAADKLVYLRASGALEVEEEAAVEEASPGGAALAGT